MTRLSEIIILSWWAAVHRFMISPFDYIALYIMTEQKGKGYQGITATLVFEYGNTRSAFKYCHY